MPIGALANEIRVLVMPIGALANEIRVLVMPIGALANEIRVLVMPIGVRTYARVQASQILDIKTPVVTALLVTRKGRVFVGTQEGHICKFKHKCEVMRLHHAHEGPVWALCACRSAIATGGKDGMIHVFSLNLKPRCAFVTASNPRGAGANAFAHYALLR